MRPGLFRRTSRAFAATVIGAALSTVTISPASAFSIRVLLGRAPTAHLSAQAGLIVAADQGNSHPAPAPDKEKPKGETKPAPAVDFKPDGLSVACTPEDAKFQAAVVRTPDGSPVVYQGRGYRGEFVVSVGPDGSLLVVNRVDIEDYLRGVVPSEMPYTWPMEALRAQAVAARTYALNRLLGRASPAYDVVATVADQLYLGLRVEKPETDAAIAATAGKVLTYAGMPIVAYFSADSGAWSAQGQYPYLSPVSALNPESPHARWKLTVPLDDLRKAYTDIADGHLTKIYFDVSAKTGRVRNVYFETDAGVVRVTGPRLRSIVGLTRLKSCLFAASVTDGDGEHEWVDVTGRVALPEARQPLGTSARQPQVGKPDAKDQAGGQGKNASPPQKEAVPETPTVPAAQPPTGQEIRIFVLDIPGGAKSVTFTGSGYGHGLGLSQWGAKMLAEQGKSFEDILKYFYTGVQVEDLETVVKRTAGMF